MIMETIKVTNDVGFDRSMGCFVDIKTNLPLKQSTALLIIKELQQENERLVEVLTLIYNEERNFGRTSLETLTKIEKACPEVLKQSE